MELIDEYITSKLNKKESFKLYSLALDENTDIKDTAQLLIFIYNFYFILFILWRINNRFEIMEEFLTMESLKGKA